MDELPIDLDSDDFEVFEVRIIKPVNKFTKKEIVEIKNRVLAKECDKNERNSSTAFQENDKSSYSINPKKRKSFGKNSDLENSNQKTYISPKKVKKTDTPEKGSKITEESPSKLITDYYSPKKSPVITNEISLPKEDKEMEVKLSQALDEITQVSMQSCEVFQNESECLTSVGSNMLTDKDYINGDGNDFLGSQTNVKVRESSYFYCLSLKNILHDTLKNQKELEVRACNEGKEFEKLFLPEEYNCFANFAKLPDTAHKLYSRMLCRKKVWHRISTINYPDISSNICDVFEILNENGFVDFNIGNEDLKVQLQILAKSEIQLLCKVFNIKVSGTSTKKCDYINSVMSNIKNQMSVKDMWSKQSDRTRLAALKLEVCRLLGKCMKLNKLKLDIFNRLLLLFSLPHSLAEDDQWSVVMRMMTEVVLGTVHFVNYEVTPAVIFYAREDLISYQRAVQLLWKLEEALMEKNLDEFTELRSKAKIKFKRALENVEFQERVSRLPSFLKIFNAGYIYARILTQCCDKMKSKTDAADTLEIGKILIDQNIFSVNKKGVWYIAMVQAFETSRQVEEAASVMIRGLKDEYVRDDHRLALQLKGLSLLKRKKDGIANAVVREELTQLCRIPYEEPRSIQINAKSVSGNERGMKSVYVQESDKGKVYSSVEEYAISYYKLNGFTEGIHAEGFIVQTLYIFLFFDIIYGPAPPGAFLTPFQEHPLDFYSKSFYESRKSAVDARLKEMESWSIENVEKIISQVFADHFGKKCLITWRDVPSCAMLCDIVTCLGIPQLTMICTRLAVNFKNARAGFPDLTVWNADTRKCKFVEVKSPKDKLRPGQRIWLHFLKNINVDCEVCNVKNEASKRLA